MKKILITGADGFIGSHLAEALVRDGHTVRAFALYNALGSRGWLDRIDPDVLNGLEIHAGDIRDAQSVSDAVEGCDHVFHLAALIGIPYSYRAAESYVDTNIRGTLNLLQAALRMKLKRFVQVSTSEVYGTAQTVPISETHPLNAQSPYAATKIGADQLVGSYHRAFDLPVTVVRPFNTYGPRQSARAVIPTIITQIAGGARTLRLGALHPTRDFTFVHDTVRGMIAASDAPEAVGETVNLCTGHEISIGTLAESIAGLMGADLEIERDSARLRPETSEVDRLCGDASKMRRLTGWTASHAGPDGLRDGLEKTIAWFRVPGNMAGYAPGRYGV